MPRFSINDVLKRPRHCKSDWLILQAECLVRFAKEHGSHTALVYGALEARNAVEQLGFELVILCRPTLGISEKDIKDCQKSQGVFEVLKRMEPDYFKLIRFTQICMSFNPGAPKLITWDIGKLRRYWNEVSKYCHYQGIASETVESEMNAWLGRGIALVEEIFSYFESNMKGASTGIIRKDSMPSEVLETWEQFRSGQIDVKAVETRFALMQPALARRRIIIPPRGPQF